MKTKTLFATLAAASAAAAIAAPAAAQSYGDRSDHARYEQGRYEQGRWDRGAYDIDHRQITIENKITGMLGSSDCGVNPRRSAKWPCWKMNTSAPNEAPIERKFRITAFSGRTTEPVSRNSRM